jgi:hypothetical protein
LDFAREVMFKTQLRGDNGLARVCRAVLRPVAGGGLIELLTWKGIGKDFYFDAGGRRVCASTPHEAHDRTIEPIPQSRALIDLPLLC